MATARDPRAKEQAGLTTIQAEILAQARTRAEALRAAAQAEAARLLAQAQAEAARDRDSRLAAARAEAARIREVALASLPLEVERMRADRRAALLEEIRAQAAGALESECDRAGRQSVLACLAAEALARMEGRVFVLVVSPRDRQDAGPALLAEIVRRAGRGPLDLTLEQGSEEGGVLVRDAEGRQRWDNRLGFRLERLWPRLRGRVLVEAGLAEDGS